MAGVHSPFGVEAPPEVVRFLADFHLRVTFVMEKNLAGIYLGGSLALGDFDPTSSDIDMIVATAEPVDAAGTARLKVMHEQLESAAGPWARRLEAGYFPLKALRRWDPGDSTYPYVSAVSPFGPCELLDRTLDHAIIRELGVIVHGPDPKTLLEPISPDDIRRAARDRLRGGDWGQTGAGPDWMRPRKYQAFAVLTMCRALYTIGTGQNTSKPKAAAWALEHLGPRWQPLITWAVASRADAAPGDMTETLAFVKFAVEQA